MANMDVACMKSILGLLSVHYVERCAAAARARISANRPPVPRTTAPHKSLA